MDAIRAVGHWLSDWRNGATIAVSVLIALLAAVTFDGISSRRQAVEALGAQANQSLSAQHAATRRIDQLTAQIGSLQSEAQSNGGRIGELVAEVHALEQQVRAMGGKPVVTEPAATTTTTTTTTTVVPRPNATTTTTSVTSPTSAAGRASTTTTTVAPTTTTTVCQGVNVLTTCVTTGRASRGAATSTGGGDGCGGWYTLVASFDWPAGKACSVLMCESRGDPNATNGRYHSLMQVANGSYDPQANLRQAHTLFVQRGWQPWTCS